MSNKDRDFYSIKPGFDSKNKELALIRLFYCNFGITKLLQKSEMRKEIVIELSYKGFSRASDYS